MYIVCYGDKNLLAGLCFLMTTSVVLEVSDHLRVIAYCLGRRRRCFSSHLRRVFCLNKTLLQLHFSGGPCKAEPAGGGS